ICSLLGVRHVVLAVNKLDLVEYDRAVFEHIAEEYARFAAPLSFASLRVIPVSARYGDNVTQRSANMPWFQGPTLLDHLETIDVSPVVAEQAFRFPVQWINRPNADFRGFSGSVAAGSIAPGDALLVTGTTRSSRVKEIVGFDGSVDRARTGDAV